MGKETSKAFERRLRAGYFKKHLTGNGIDIGCGDDLLRCYLSADERTVFPAPDSFNCRGWDKENGDAHKLQGIDNETFDFVYSSHCLEHLDNPSLALYNWWRVLKSGGHLFVMVPDAELYEQGVWPSRGNGEHKTRWYIARRYVDREPQDRILSELVAEICSHSQILSVQLCDNGYNYDLAKQGWRDQSDVAEVGIEIIVKKMA